MATFAPQPNGSTAAQAVVVHANQLQHVRLKAPSDAPVTQGEWVPLAGGAGDLASEATTEFYSDSYYKGGDSVGTVDPDDLDPNDSSFFDGEDTRYPGVWMEVDYDAATDIDNQYYEVGVTTFSASSLTSGAGGPLPTALPNQVGPILQASSGGGTYVWKIDGQGEYFTGDETDSASLQFNDLRLHLSLVPEELLTEHRTNEWQWTSPPTKTQLDSLMAIATYSAPTIGSLSWYGNSNGRYADFPFVQEITIDPSWIVNGRAHFAYWLARASQPERTLSTHLSVASSTTIAWVPTASNGPLDTYTGMYCASDVTGNVGGYDNASLTGYWEYADGDVWLSSLGSDSGGRFGYASAPYMQYFDAPVIFHWTFSQITTNDFGFSIQSYPWTRGVIITPDRIILRNAGTTTVLATHSTPFAAGEQVEVQLQGGVVTVWRAGVQVSTCAMPSGVLRYYPMFWALAPNSGNRIRDYSTSSFPSDRHSVYAYIELDYGDDRSEFTGPGPTAYRFDQAIGYPEATIETWPSSSGDEKAVVMWLRVESNTPAIIDFGAQNTNIADGVVVSPTGWLNQIGFTVDVGLERSDGEVIFYKQLGFSEDQHFAWNMYDRDRGFFAAADDTQYIGSPEPYGHLSVSPEFPVYLRFVLSRQTGSVRYDTVNWNKWWADYWFYTRPRLDVPAPKVWKWQPGDNHFGTQGIGYTHKTTMLDALPERTVSGMALVLSDQHYGYERFARDTIFGYADDVGVFFYGTVQPDGLMTRMNSYDETMYYDVLGGSCDDDGRIFANERYGPGWVAFHQTYPFIIANDFTKYNYTSDIGNIYDYNNYYTATDHGSSSYSLWRITPTGLVLTAGSNTADSVLTDTSYANDHYNIDIRLTFGSASDNGGLFIRGDSPYTPYVRVKVSRSALIDVNNGVETVLATWTPAVDGDTIRCVAVGTSITIYVNSTQVATATVASTSHVYYGLWARGDAGIATFKATRLVAWGSQLVPSLASQSTSESQTGLELLDEAQQPSINIGRTIRDVLPWPTTVDTSSDSGEPPAYIILWTTTSPLHPDSVYVLVHTTVGGVDAYRQFELDKESGSVVSEMTPFVDVLSANTANYFAMRAPVKVFASQDGTRLLGSIARHDDDNSFGSVTNYLFEYDIALQTIVAQRPLPSDTGIFEGFAADGSQVYVEAGVPGLYTATGTWRYPSLEEYAGRGRNHVYMGFDGRYIWFGCLNGHIDATAYILQPHDVVGTIVPAGTVTSLRGSGVYLYAQTFTEFYRYDVTSLGDAVTRTTIILTSNSHDNNLKLEALFPDGTSYTIPGVNTGVVGTEVGIGTWSVDQVRWRFSDITNGQVWTEADTTHVQRTSVTGFDWVGYQYNFDDGGVGGFSDGDFNDLVTQVRYYTDESLTPVQYVFNLDHEVPQSFGSRLKPTVTITQGNKLTHNQWSPTSTSGFTFQYGGGISVITPGALRLEVNASSAGQFTLTGPQLSTMINGRFNYFYAYMEARLVGGSVSGNILLEIIGYDSVGGILEPLSGPQPDYISNINPNIDAPLGWVKIYGPAYYYGPSMLPSTAVSIGLRVTVNYGHPDSVIEFRHFNLINQEYDEYSFYNQSGHDYDPALGATFANVTGWYDDTYDHANQFYRANGGFPAVFKPEFVNITAGLRKPPSQRNAEFIQGRIGRTIQSMLPGTMGGSVANASPNDVTYADTTITPDLPPADAPLGLSRPLTISDTSGHTYDVNSDVVVVTGTPTLLLPLVWTDIDGEKLDIGVDVEGVSSGDSYLFINVLRDGVVVRSYEERVNGHELVSFPGIIFATQGSPTYALQLSISDTTNDFTAGRTFTIATGALRWFISKRSAHS